MEFTKREENNLDVHKKRLRLANCFTRESNGLGWLEIDIKNLDLEDITQISVNLGEVREVEMDLCKDMMKYSKSDSDIK